MTADPDEFLKIEYEALWRYYMRCLDECHRVAEFYLRAIAVPAGLAGALITYLASRPEAGVFRYKLSMGALLGVIFLAGLAVFTVYVKENENSRRYLRALDAIRNVYRAGSRQLAEALVIDQLPRCSPRRFGSIGFWRSAILIVINAGIGTAAVALAFWSLPNWIVGGAFLGIVLGHLYWNRLARAYYALP